MLTRAFSFQDDVRQKVRLRANLTFIVLLLVSVLTGCGESEQEKQARLAAETRILIESQIPGVIFLAAVVAVGWALFNGEPEKDGRCGARDLQRKQRNGHSRRGLGIARASLASPGKRKDGKKSSKNEKPKNLGYFAVDASNVCRNYDQGKPASIVPLLTTLCAISARKGNFVCVADASLPHVLAKEEGKASEVTLRELARRHPKKFVIAPARTQADDRLLEIANQKNCKIISNDQFKEFTEKYKWLKTDRGRRVTGRVKKGELKIPNLEIKKRMDKKVRKLVSRLEYTMQKK